MSPLNNQEKIKVLFKVYILKVLFNNSRDTLSLKDRDNIRYSINKYIDIYNRYINKTKLNKAQQSKLDDTINILMKYMIICQIEAFPILIYHIHEIK